MRCVEESYRGERVRIFRLDSERVVATLRERARKLIAAHPRVREVRLFGSLARGTATPGSDADVWVLMEDDTARLLDRIAEIARHFEGAGVGCDVLVHTQSEWDRLWRERRRIVADVLGGLELARR